LSILPSNSFYSSFAKKKGFTGGYQAPVNSAWAGVANAAPKPPSAPPSPQAGFSGPSGPPQGFTVTQGGLPPDPAYQMTMGGLTQTRDRHDRGLQQQRGAGLQEYGYTEDPNTHAVAFDPNNPYSQAALLRKHYQQAKTGNTTSYAAKGQLYAGSLQNAQNASTDQFNASDDALTRGIINFLAANTTAQTTAHNAFNTNAGIALGQSVHDAPNNPLYNPLVGTGGAVYGDRQGRQRGDHGGQRPARAGAAAGQQHGEARQRLVVLLDAKATRSSSIPPGG
jgi:hypothetical protein